MTEAVCLAWGKPDPQHIALLVHGFYPDRLADLLQRIPQPDGESSGRCVDLYLSTPLQQLESVAELLKAQGWRRVRLFGLDNRGRDQAPFLLHLLPAALREGHEVFVKLHTKRSSHLSDGEAWAKHLFDSLASPKALQHCLERLQHNPGLGLLAPAGTLMPCSVALSANVDHLLTLCTHWGVSPATLLQQRFIAGSMMAGRLKALQPICQLGLQLADFEPEQGQTDGTLAHAMERWLCCSSAAQGWQIEELPGELSAVPDFGHGRPPDDQSRPASDLR
jgi:lipopolysaccharide biosynthesis protein